MAYSDAVRAQCMAALLAGQRVGEVARAHKVPQSTVSRWKAALQRSGAFLSDDNGFEKRIGVLISEYLEEIFRTLIEQTKVFREREFLQGQAASEVAVLHGVQFDKAIRVLEAAQAGAGSEPAEPADPGEE